VPQQPPSFTDSIHFFYRPDTVLGFFQINILLPLPISHHHRKIREDFAMKLSREEKIKLAEFEGTPDEVLDYLIDYGDLILMTRIIQHANISAQTAQKIIREYPREGVYGTYLKRVQYKLTENPNFPAMLDLMREFDSNVLANLAAESKNRKIVEKLLEIEDSHWAALAKRTDIKLTQTIQAKLLGSTDKKTLHNLLTNPRLLAELADEVLSNGNEAKREMLALNPKLDVKTLEKLLQDQNRQVRLNALMNNENITEELFMEHIHDECDEVREYIARKSENPEILELLSQDRSVKVREAVRDNKFCNIRTRRRLNNDETISRDCKNLIMEIMKERGVQKVS
jgi:hypothetical protein